MPRKRRSPHEPLKRADCRLAVDIGGTFTDVALEQGAARTTVKVLTTPENPDAGVLEGISLVLEKARVRPGEIGLFIHGTTLATNALIERKGAKTALITTSGFRDVIEIGRESRFDQYDINLQKPAPLVPRDLRLTVDERIAADGKVLKPLDLRQVEQIATTLEAERVESAAVAFLHSYAWPNHERAFRDALRDRLPRLWISLSSEVSGEIREYERFMTTCANAYVQPIMASYLRRLEERVQQAGLECPLLLITSSGGLTTLESACRFPIRLVESGPAGGAILAAWIARQCKLENLLSFDMGGTTAKICLIDNFEPSKTRSFEVARTKRFMKGSGMPIRIPVVEMVEIGAGGGSIARIDSLDRLRVGPESAASLPGPACFGRGGKLPTVTDADLVLGKIDPALFAAGRVPLEADLAHQAVLTIGQQQSKPDSRSAAAGIAEIVGENMANASRVHAIERGKDITRRAMIAFGGAAPLHAARLAEKLDIATVVVPKHAGVGSAVGFLRAPLSYEVVRSLVVKIGAFDAAKIESLFGEMEAEGRAIVGPAAERRKLTCIRTAFARYTGQGHEIEISLPSRGLVASDAALLSRTFDRDYRKLFGRNMPNADIEVLSWSVVVTAGSDQHKFRPPARAPKRYQPKSRATRGVYDFQLGKTVANKIYWREDLRPGATLAGPAIIAEEETSTVVSSRFRATVNTLEYLVLTRL